MVVCFQLSDHLAQFQSACPILNRILHLPHERLVRGLSQWLYLMMSIVLGHVRKRREWGLLLLSIIHIHTQQVITVSLLLLIYDIVIDIIIVYRLLPGLDCLVLTLNQHLVLLIYYLFLIMLARFYYLCLYLRRVARFRNCTQSLRCAIIVMHVICWSILLSILIIVDRHFLDKIVAVEVSDAVVEWIREWVVKLDDFTIYSLISVQVIELKAISFFLLALHTVDYLQAIHVRIEPRKSPHVLLIF